MNEGSASLFEVNAIVPHNCGRALLDLIRPNELSTATNQLLCMDQLPVNVAEIEPKADSVALIKKRNLFRIEYMYSVTSSTTVHAAKVS